MLPSSASILVSMHIQLQRTSQELLIKEPADDTQTLSLGSATLHLPALLDELRVVRKRRSYAVTGRRPHFVEAAPWRAQHLKKH